jgi:predicted component of type VI protein secretion system
MARGKKSDSRLAVEAATCCDTRVVDSLLLPDGNAVAMTDGMLIGRDPSCAVALDATAVSREHAAINQRAEQRWYVSDLGSRNGTFVDDVRLSPGASCRLRHGSRLRIANLTLVVSLPTASLDPGGTSSIELAGVNDAMLSPYQRRVVHHLAQPWLLNGSEPLSNAEIATELGTPDAVDAVKAALRRAYAKAGLADAPVASKRRALCRVARERGWV